MYNQQKVKKFFATLFKMAKYKKKIKYYYFDAYARGELPRLILGYNKVPFEDVRLNKETWPEIKPITLFGLVPFIDFDGKKIYQSGVISKYLAQEFRQYPTDPEEVLFLEQLRDFFVLDINEEFNRHWYLKDQAKQDYLDKFFSTTLPNRLEKLEAILKKGNGEFLVGNSISLADFYALEFSQRILFNPDWKDRAEPVLEKFPVFKAYINKRIEDPNYQAYVKVRVNH